MSTKLRIAYFAHSIRSDWNNGNAHFLRGLLRAMVQLGHAVHAFEPADNWSSDNLSQEPGGAQSLSDFERTYAELPLSTYAESTPDTEWYALLDGTQVVILHEWNPPALAHQLLRLRPILGFKLLFHDTHHRASSSPEQMQRFGLDRFDGIIAFGEILRTLYRERFGLTCVWTLHEAADTTCFYPQPAAPITQDVVWIGNWGDDERSQEIRDFLLEPLIQLPQHTAAIYGVRYPEIALRALAEAHVDYRGYLPNLAAPAVYAQSRVTVHIPRRAYATTMIGIPTIRVFEALACGTPLVSAPWEDTEALFRPEDFTFVSTSAEMQEVLRHLLAYPAQAKLQAARGRETVLARHTCVHRAQELTRICEEVLA